jgi:hypothetical protein
MDDGGGYMQVLFYVLVAAAVQEREWGGTCMRYVSCRICVPQAPAGWL